MGTGVPQRPLGGRPQGAAGAGHPAARAAAGQAVGDGVPGLLLAADHGVGGVAIPECRHGAGRDAPCLGGRPGPGTIRRGAARPGARRRTRVRHQRPGPGVRHAGCHVRPHRRLRPLSEGETRTGQPHRGPGTAVRPAVLHRGTARGQREAVRPGCGADDAGAVRGGLRRVGDRLQHRPPAFGAGRADPAATLERRPHPDPGGTGRAAAVAAAGRRRAHYRPGRDPLRRAHLHRRRAERPRRAAGTGPLHPARHAPDRGVRPRHLAVHRLPAGRAARRRAGRGAGPAAGRCRRTGQAAAASQQACPRPAGPDHRPRRTGGDHRDQRRRRPGRAARPGPGRRTRHRRPGPGHPAAGPHRPAQPAHRLRLLEPAQAPCLRTWRRITVPRAGGEDPGAGERNGDAG